MLSSTTYFNIVKKSINTFSILLEILAIQDLSSQVFHFPP